MNKIVIELDGRIIVNKADFHAEIARLLNFPEWYGKNLDALWDLLTGYCDTNIRLTWKYHKISQDNLGVDFDKIVSVFNDLKKPHPEFEFILD